MRELVLILVMLLWCGGALAKNYCSNDAKGCWVFAERSGTSVSDSSGNGNTGTLAKPTWITTPLPSRSYINQAVSFNGTTDKITTGTVSNQFPTDGTAWSMAAWFYTATINAFPLRIIDKSSGTTGPSVNIVSNGEVEFIAAGGTQLQRISAVGTYSINTWTHIIVTWDGSTTAANSHIYINGTEVSYSSTIDGATLTNNSSSQFVIGSRNADNTRVWDKYLTEIAVWNRVLSSAEVTDIYNNGLGVTHTNILTGKSIIRGGSTIN